MSDILWIAWTALMLALSLYEYSQWHACTTTLDNTTPTIDDNGRVSDPMKE